MADKYAVLPPDTNWRNVFRVGDVQPSPPDPRDFPALARAEQPVSLPSSFRLPDRIIRNQGGKGACTAFGMGRIMERGFEHAGRSVDVSEEDMYAELRRRRGELCQDPGSYPRECAAISVADGWVTEADKPYNDRDLCSGPHPNRAALAAANRGVEFRLCRSIDDVRQIIYQYRVGVTACYTVYDNFFSIGRDGKMPMPAGRPAGGHLMCFEGWTEQDDIIANSWSAGFGHNGYVYAPRQLNDGTIPAERGGLWLGDLWVVIVNAPTPVPEPEDEDMQRAIEIIRRREREQFDQEAMYYAQGDRYRGDQCWWAAVNLGEAAKELEAMTSVSRPALTPRGPETMR